MSNNAITPTPASMPRKIAQGVVSPAARTAQARRGYKLGDVMTKYWPSATAASS